MSIVMTTPSSPLILSGIQPTGSVHLGNYLGAIRQWIPLQRQASCLFFIVDAHAITVPQAPEALRAHVRLAAASYIACGIDPTLAPIFVQSSVPEHAELAWILNCLTPLGWLNRMTQFKEKGGKEREQACLGLLAYPVLMAADILLYHTKKVPVGEDQKQHIELARDIALAFNRHTKSEYFTLPEPLIQPQTARVMSLRDGLKKMSKSDPSEASRIHLTDDAACIAQKIRKAKSDADVIREAGKEARPELMNLLGILATLQGKTVADTLLVWEGKGFSELKTSLIEQLIATITPIGAEIRRLTADPTYLDAVLQDGQQVARAIAQKTMREVREKMGLWS